MKDLIIVKTYTKKEYNYDGQHDCAGTWAIEKTPAWQKNQYYQLARAESIKYLAHVKDGELENIYKVTGFHSERRDGGDREEGKVGISVGIRFHLNIRLDSNVTLHKIVEDDLVSKVKANGWSHIRDCQIIKI